MRTLCLDATASRGAIPAAVVAELELRSERPAADLFDLIVGSSAGALIALALARPHEGSAVGARVLQELFEYEIPRALNDRPAWSRLRGRPESPTDSALGEVCAKLFGDVRIADARTPVVVPLYDLRARRPLVFSTVAARGDERANLPMAALAYAALALPPWRPAMRFQDPGLKRSMALVDGSIYVAPALLALSFLAPSATGQPLIVSISGGHSEQPLDPEERDGGDWAAVLAEVARDGQSKIADSLVEQLLGTGRYLHIAPKVDAFRGPRLDHDFPDPQLLRDVARHLISERRSDIEAVTTQLAAAV